MCHNFTVIIGMLASTNSVGKSRTQNLTEHALINVICVYKYIIYDDNHLSM